MFLKICGTTTLADAEMSARAGADALGIIVNHAVSPRHVAIENARAIAGDVAASVPIVAVSVNQSLEALEAIAAQLHPLALQLHGDESPELVRQLVARDYVVWKALSGDAATLRQHARIYTDAGAVALLIDARETTASGVVYGGTGHVADWNAARALVDDGFRVILAGGLTPENVARAIETVRPWGVDVVSGVEARKGVKDAEKVRAFARNVRAFSCAS